MSLKKLDDYRYLIPKSFQEGMKVEGLIYANDELIGAIEKDKTLEQVANVATLPGLVGRSLAMPDAHQGYGFAIGGVAAADLERGIVSAGGVGFDINCGVRLLRTNLSVEEIKPRVEDLIYALFSNVPSGLGSEGKLRISEKELDKALVKGAAWAVERGMGEALRGSEGGLFSSD